MQILYFKIIYVYLFKKKRILFTLIITIYICMYLHLNTKITQRISSFWDATLTILDFHLYNMNY
jgi:hypothetical protein